MSLEYVDYNPNKSVYDIPVNYTAARIGIAVEIAKFKEIVAFEKIIMQYSEEAIEAMFNLAQRFLKNETLSGPPPRQAEIVTMLEFFKYSTYRKSPKWWEELYGAHLMNEVLGEIMRLIL